MPRGRRGGHHRAQPRGGDRTALHQGPGHGRGPQGRYERRGVRRQRAPRPQRHRSLGRPPAQDGGPERGAVHPPVQGRAPGSRAPPWKAALATPIDKYRITFALPWEDILLLGTTDEEYEGDPADVSVTEKDIAQILDEAAFSIRDQQLSRDLITYSFAGLRVLPGGPGDTSKAKRETVVTEGRGGMLSVAGGKWTTFRHIGRTVMKKLESLPGRPLGEDFEPISELPKKMPLPGVANPRAVAHRLLVDGPAPGPRMGADTAKHLATHYGSLAFDIARLANENPELAERVQAGHPGDLGAGRVGPRPRVGRDDRTTCCAAVRR